MPLNSTALLAAAASRTTFIRSTTVLPVLNGDEWNPPYHPIAQAIIWILAVLLSLETIIGNAMVVLAYKIERSISKQVNNRFIVSLAISDLIIGIEGIPLFTVYVINGDRWPLGSIACETWLFLDYTLCLVSILTVLLITADRYLSVCHTAKYLKWQNPWRIQVLIILSWVIPALIFGVMIYGWGFLSGESQAELSKATSNGECYAPFLSNPYVNMSMYLAYYWTTLIAMLILYKGIHQAAKKLENKGKAKEHRHIALLLTQRLGTQVGVSLMLHSQRQHELMQEKAAERDNLTKDSGYNTNNALSSTIRNTADYSAMESMLESRRSSALEKYAPLTPAYITNGDVVMVQNDSESPKHDVKKRMVKKCGNVEKVLPRVESVPAISCSNLGLGNGFSASSKKGEEPCVLVTNHLQSILQEAEEEHREERQGIELERGDVQGDQLRCRKDRDPHNSEEDHSLSTLSQTHTSVLRYHPMPPANSADTPTNITKATITADSTNHVSLKKPKSPKIRRHSHQILQDRQSTQESLNLLPKSKEILSVKPESRRPSHNHGHHKTSSSSHATLPLGMAEGMGRQRRQRSWIIEMTRRLSHWMGNYNTGFEGKEEENMRKITRGSRSYSSSSSISSSTNGSPKRQHSALADQDVPMVTITRERNSSAGSIETICRQEEGERGPSGLAPTELGRKLSVLTKNTGDRFLNSLFAPISAINRRRKRTKAEKRAHKAFRTITFIVGLFALLWSPYYVVATVYGFCKGECIPGLLYNLAYYACYLNSSLNPFCYSLANKKFKLAFMRMFRGNFKNSRAI